MLGYSVCPNAAPSHLQGLDLSTVVPSYDAEKEFQERPGLAVCLGHVQSLEPENAFRDAADVCELIETSRALHDALIGAHPLPVYREG